jgi:thiol-disulfide isomerase/thioredoxin
MKNTILIIVFLVLTSSSFGKDLKIIGKFQNASNHSLVMTFGPDPLSGNKEVVNITLDDNGEFILNYRTLAPEWVTFIFDQNYKNIGWFMTFPGDNINISGDLKDLKSTLKYSGSNRNYDKYEEIIRGSTQYINSLTFKDTTNINWKEINNNLDRRTNERLYRLDSISKKGLLSKIELSCTRANIKYLKYSELLGLSNKAYNRIDKRLFLNYYKKEIQDDSAALISNSYNTYIEYYIAILNSIENGTLNKRPKVDFNLYKGYYETGLRELKGLTLDVYLTRQIIYCLNTGIKEIDALYEKYLSDCKSQFLKDITKKEFELYKIAAKGTDNLSFKIITEPSISFTSFINEFRGKVLMIEFWGSWCAPCIRSLPLLKKLELEFENQDFQLIQVSVSDTYDNLEFALKKYGLSGVHILLNESTKRKWKESVDFSGVPYYCLIDRNGQIAEKGALDMDFESQIIKNKINTILKNR